MGRPILSPGKKLTGEKTDRYTGFYHKAQPGEFCGFYEGGFLGFYGFYVDFYKTESLSQLPQPAATLQFFCANSAGLKRNSLIRTKAVCISVCIF